MLQSLYTQILYEHLLLQTKIFFFFFFNDTATTEIYTLSLHDALPICRCRQVPARCGAHASKCATNQEDRKSTRLNSSHANISYAVFCLKKKNITNTTFPTYIMKQIVYISMSHVIDAS